MGWSSSVAFTLLSEDGILVGVIVESSSFFFGLKAFMIIAPRLTAKPTICIAARPCPNMTMEAVNVVTFRVRLMRLVVNAPNLEMQIKMNTCPIAEHMPSAKMSIIHEIQKKNRKMCEGKLYMMISTWPFLFLVSCALTNSSIN